MRVTAGHIFMTTSGHQPTGATLSMGRDPVGRGSSSGWSRAPSLGARTLSVSPRVWCGGDKPKLSEISHPSISSIRMSRNSNQSGCDNFGVFQKCDLMSKRSLKVREVNHNWVDVSKLAKKYLVPLCVRFSTSKFTTSKRSKKTLILY